MNSIQTSPGKTRLNICRNSAELLPKLMIHLADVAKLISSCWGEACLVGVACLIGVACLVRVACLIEVECLVGVACLIEVACFIGVDCLVGVFKFLLALSIE